MVTGSVRGGSPPLGLMVCTPAPGILNVMVSGPTLATASRMACRKEAAPLSFVLVTTRGAARGGVLPEVWNCGTGDPAEFSPARFEVAGRASRTEASERPINIRATERLR